MEIVGSNTLQPLKLLYNYNVVTHTAGIIFINNSYYIQYGPESEDSKKCFETGKIARLLLEDELSFANIRTYCCLSKSQVIEKLDML